MGRRALLRALGSGAVGLAAAALPALSRADTGADFDAAWPGDVWLARADARLLETTLARLRRVERTVGHGNFHTLGFDAMLRFGRGHASVGPFTRAELDFIERIFHADARRYGFMGSKVATRLTEPVPRTLVRPSGTAQRLVRGDALGRFEKMRAEVGEDLVLTSGVRGVVKQARLFLAKVAASGGNLSRASRSLAPPGYSYHGIGDFDVGQRGLGAANFTERFASTELYRRLVGAGHLVERYPIGNTLGVRHEPWHVMVIAREPRDSGRTRA